jgi:hypothetical protein
LNFACVGHALFARDGVKLAFGRYWDGKVIHVSVANRGSACGCLCPGCGRKLIARKPDSDIKHHFAHAPVSGEERAAGVAPNCQHGAMTALHAYAEQLLSDRKTMVLPPVEAKLGQKTKTLRGAGSFVFDRAELETSDGKTVPDVILHRGSERMHVEIFVTHRCGAEKIARLAAADISVVEIDLSALSREVTLNELDEAILATAPRKWLHNRKAKKLKAEMEAEAERAQAREHERRARDAERAKTAYSAALARAQRADWKGCAEVAELIRAGHDDLLETATGGEGHFIVHPKVWKAAILGHLLAAVMTPASAVSEFRRNGWVDDRVALAPRDASVIGGGAEGAALRFLKFLAGKGIAEDQLWRWTCTPSHHEALRLAEADRRRAAENAAVRAKRNAFLQRVVAQIVGLGDAPESAAFDMDAWMSTETAGRASPDSIVEGGWLEWRKFEDGLNRTLAVLQGKADPPADSFGLPVVRALQSLHAAHLASVAAARDAAEQAERLEGVRRAELLASEAELTLSQRLPDWLDAPNSRLGGMTPHLAAMRSAEDCDRAVRLLHWAAKNDAAKMRWESELEAAAASLLGSPEKAKLYMDAGEKINGLSPRAFVIDKATKNECLLFLKERMRRRRR